MAGLVEQFGRLGVGVVVEELIEHGERVWVGLPCFEALGRAWDREAGGLPAAEADVQVDLVGFVERDVLDQQAGDALAFSRGCGLVGPQFREVGGELADLGFARFGEVGVSGGGLAVVFVLGGLQRAQRVVPVGFEGVGDEPVVGVDGEVSATGELGVVAGSVDVGAAELIGLGGAAFELGLDGERDVERERSDGLEQQIADRTVDRVSGEMQADRAAALDVVVGAAVVRHERVAALVIAD